MSRYQTLPDFLADDLDIVSVGINPSPSSVQRGYPFASDRNRFWDALNQSRLVSAKREPSVDAMRSMLELDRIGFTDIVKRPTRSANDLSSADFKHGTEVLIAKLQRFSPRIVWFQGMTAARHYFRNAPSGSVQDLHWGRLSQQSSDLIYFVSPNPSSANATFSKDDLVRFLNQLADIKVGLEQVGL